MYRVLSIVKNKDGKTIGARVFDGKSNHDVQTATLKEMYKQGIVFDNAILTSDGFVRAKAGGSLKVEEYSNVVHLYHGSINGIRGSISLNKNIGLCDFGNGFYLGTDKMQAIDRVATSINSKLYEYDLDLDSVRVYSFTDDVLWALYIGYNRGLITRELSKCPNLIRYFKGYIDNFDVIEGFIADDKMATAYNHFMTGALTDVGLIECLKLVSYGRQYAIKTQNAVDNLVKSGNKILSNKEKTRGRTWGDLQRKGMLRNFEVIHDKYMETGSRIVSLLRRYEDYYGKC